MGLFTKSKPKQNDVEEKERKSIIVTTTEEIPGRKYEVLGLVTAEVVKTFNSDIIHVSKELQRKAEKVGGDAIIGFRATVFVNQGNFVTQTAYGTAIRFLDENEGGE